MPEDASTPAPGPQPRHDDQGAQDGRGAQDGDGGQGGHGAPGGHGGHGTSVAAWTASLGVTFGALLVCVAMIFVLVWLVVVGVVVIVVAALSGPVLARAGFGASTQVREFTGEPRAVR